MAAPISPQSVSSPDVEALLGVERSTRGKRWLLREAEERAVLSLMQQHGLSEPVARALTARGVTTEATPGFLAPRLREQLPDPSSLTDMDGAVDRVLQAIRAGEGIAIFGDYDVDGATSAALLLRFLTVLGVSPRLYVPDRQREGYGPNAEALKLLREEGASLVITVDCGVSAHDALEQARAVGLDSIVLDHHAAEARLPPAVAVVNPNRWDDDSGLGQLAAVGVTYLFLVALNRALRSNGWYEQQGHDAPDLLGLLDLVALGTVCDVVPLTGLNRAFVAQGLKVLAGRRNEGLRALCDVAGVAERPGGYHLGFLLGPRVNAGGRIGESHLGATLLSEGDPAQCRALAERLDRYNQERRAIEAEVLVAADAISQNAGAPRDLVFAVGQDWHPGVIGIVAGRLKERYDLPTVVVTQDANGLGKGSGRSVPGVDLGAAVIAARQAGLLVNGGGHAMAAGLTVEADKVTALESFLRARIAARLKEIAYRPALSIDACLSLAAAQGSLVEALDRIAPFGAGNPEPRFAFAQVKTMSADIVGSNHVRAIFGDESGARLRAIAFRALETPLGERLLARSGRPLHVAGRLRADAWRGGDAVQLQVDDVAESGQP